MRDVILHLTALLLIAFAFASRAAAADAPPNVLFIAVDDLNDWVGCLGGNPQSVTPNLDRLAARGLLFRQAYCSAPACNPSRTALLTGLRPATSGVYLNSQPWRPALPDAVTLPRLFRTSGYEVTGGGKIFHGGWNDPTAWDEYLAKSGDPRPSQAVQNDPHSRAGGIVWGTLDATDKQMSDYRVVTDAIAHLNQQHERPFFIACGIYRPHMPWQVPQKYYDQFPVEQIVLPEVPGDDLMDLPPAALKMAKPQGDHATMLATDNWKYAVQGYLASVAFADGQIGRLLDGLDASGHADDTIVVLWGDHGWHLGEKQHWRKFALWEEATRAPLMMVVPGITQPGSVCDRPVEFIHIYPTLCELCGLTPSPNLDGTSLVPLLKTPQATWNRPAVTTHGRGNHAVRSERWRYIRYAEGGEELYDHDNDPDEWTNLAERPESRPVIQQLRQSLPTTNAPNAAAGAGGSDDDEQRPQRKRR